MSQLLFCEFCDNRLYFTADLSIKEPGRDGLFKYCRNCSTTERVEVTDEIVELKTTVLDKTILKKEQYLNNKFIEYDMTLPRVDIECPFTGCKGQESLLIVYDQENMSTLYKCLEPGCGRWHE